MKAIGAGFSKALDFLGKLCEFICEIIALVMVVVVFAQVVLRMFNAPLFGLEELLTFPTIWLYFLGGACASFTNAHIECGLISAVSKNKKLVAVAQCFANVCCSVLSVYVLKWALEYAQYSLTMHKTSALLKIPMPIGELIVFIGLLLMAIFTVAKTVQGFFELKPIFKEGGTA